MSVEQHMGHSYTLSVREFTAALAVDISMRSNSNTRLENHMTIVQHAQGANLDCSRSSILRTISMSATYDTRWT